jgi:outer membrane protein assembly factor BamE
MKMALYRVYAGVLVLLAAALLPACKSVELPKVPGVTPYRMVIQQGNFISQEMVAQLKPGMTKEQVRFILGTPLVTDIFHADRWDYVFFRETPDGKREQRNLSVVFEKDKLARVLGDLLPAEGAAPQATGFPPLAKPAAKPEAVAKPAAKPAAETPQPTAETVNPAAEAPTTAEEKKEPGFFDRLREKIGL